MFDPTSMTVIVVFSLCIVPSITFAAYVILFRHFENSPGTCHRLARRKTRTLLSLVSGIKITLIFYVLSLVFLWEYASVVSVSGIAVRVLMFAGLCTIGTYIGTTLGSWIFGPKSSPNLSSESS